MKDFSFRNVLALMAKTMPFLVFRFLIYMGLTIGFLLVSGVGAGIGAGLGLIAGNAAAGSAWGGIAGFGVAGGILILIREYLLYIVKAGHIAVLVEIAQGHEIPGGKGQIDYARRRVQERFGTSSLLFGLDQLIKGILRAFNRVFLSLASLFPLAGASAVAGIANKIINLSLTYLDEVILAYLMKTRAENPWAASRTALILYAQNYTAFLRNAVWLAAFIWGLTIAVFVAVLAPAAILAYLIPGVAGVLSLIVALVFAWGLKQALIEPVGMTALMQVYFKVTEGQVANPDWEAKLDRVSARFSKLAGKARDWKGPDSPQPAPVPVAPPPPPPPAPAPG